MENRVRKGEEKGDEEEEAGEDEVGREGEREYVKGRKGKEEKREV